MADWDKLRPSTDVRSSFEELCCQLARYEQVPENSTFVRNAPPDGGVECFWELPDGSEWGWQAKYFRHTLTPSQWSQIDESVKKALHTHPKLTKYVVCLPMNRSHSPKRSQRSCYEKWKDHVKNWREIRDVEFEYWGSSEIGDRLCKDHHKGRYKYFFDKEFLSKDWLNKSRKMAIENAGPRYSQELNVNLPIAKIFEALGRTRQFHDIMKRIYRTIARDARYGMPARVITEAGSKFEELGSNIDEIGDILRSTDKLEQKPIDSDKIHDACKRAGTIIFEILAKLQERSKRCREENSERRAHETGDFDNIMHHLQQLEKNLSKLARSVRNRGFQTVNTGALLLRGEAGTGKTHLFCDVMNQRAKSGKVSVMLHGGHFKDANPLVAILEELDLRCTFDEFLGAMDAAGQASGSRALVMIDALNEGNGSQIWPAYLPGLLIAVARYPWVGIALSVRTPYEQFVIPTSLGPEKLSRLTHDGFRHNIEDALKIFFDANGIERPSVPMLISEFSNPQFLVILLRWLKNEGLTRIPDILGKLTSVYGLFLGSVDEKLSGEANLDYSIHGNIVRKAVDALVDHMISRDCLFLKYTDADSLLREIYPASLDSKSLLRNLISEGVLNKEFVNTESSNSEPVIRFAYERLAENLIIQRQLKGIGSEGDVRSLFRENGAFARYLSSPEQYGGMIDALSIQLPERFHKELIEVNPELAESEIVRRSFLDSLTWRSPSSIRESTRLQIGKFLDNKLNLDMVLRMLLTISTDPENSLNGKYIHKFLLKLDVGDRDSIWSTFLHRDWSRDDSIVRRCIDWAWNANKSTLTQRSAYLAGLALVWFLTSSNRSVRDKATKALVSLLSDRMDTLVEMLPEFGNCNDPYVTERLFCVAYGCAMRSDDRAQLQRLAEYTYSAIFEDGDPPPNILLRDYARGIIDYALHKGIRLNIDSSKTVPPYNSEWIENFPSTEDVEELKRIHASTQHGDGAFNIFFSLSWMGDFYSYILEGHSNSFQWSSVPLPSNKIPKKRMWKKFNDGIKNDQEMPWENYLADTSKKEQFRQTLTEPQLDIFDKYVVPCVECPPDQEPQNSTLDSGLLARWIAKRVFELGWTEERFGEYDQDAARYDLGRSNRRNERMGKKYQWIAYYELLARASDNFEFIGDFTINDFDIYDGPWQLIHLRNIDPSLLIAGALESSPDVYYSGRWSPFMYNDWNPAIDDIKWLKGTSDLPSFESIIEHTDPGDGSKWLVLGTSISLNQPTPADQEPFEIPNRSISFFVESYLTRKTEIQKLYDHGKKLDWGSERFPEHGSTDNIFLGELYWNGSVEQSDRYDEPLWIDPNDDRFNLPVRVYVSTRSYVDELSEYDHSSDANITMLVPNRLLVEKMKLGNECNGTFVDSQGKTIAYDPSVNEQCPSMLLMRKDKFMQFLLENDYEIVWRILGQKMILSDITAALEKRKGELEIYGIYKMTDGKIKGIRKQHFSS